MGQRFGRPTSWLCSIPWMERFPGKFDHRGALHTHLALRPSKLSRVHATTTCELDHKTRVRIARLWGGSTADLNSFPCAGVGFQKSTVHESAAAARVGLQIDVSPRRRRKLITPLLGMGSNVGKLIAAGFRRTKKACLPLSQTQPCLQKRTLAVVSSFFQGSEAALCGKIPVEVNRCVSFGMDLLKMGQKVLVVNCDRRPVSNRTELTQSRPYYKHD